MSVLVTDERQYCDTRVTESRVTANERQSLAGDGLDEAPVT